jgi:nitrate reductase NapAB chaperone NapD
MPVCSYLVIPEPGSTEAVIARLGALPGCEAVRAENREVILLVTDTAGPQHEAELRSAMDGIDGILTMVLTFGDLEDGAPLVQLGGPSRGGAA